MQNRLLILTLDLCQGVREDSNFSRLVVGANQKLKIAVNAVVSQKSLKCGWKDSFIVQATSKGKGKILEMAKMILDGCSMPRTQSIMSNYDVRSTTTLQEMSLITFHFRYFSCSYKQVQFKLKEYNSSFLCSWLFSVIKCQWILLLFISRILWQVLLLELYKLSCTKTSELTITHDNPLHEILWHQPLILMPEKLS